MKETKRQKWKKILKEVYRQEDCIVFWSKDNTVCIPMRLIDFEDMVSLMRIALEFNEHLKEVSETDDLEWAHLLVLSKRAKDLNRKRIWDKIRNFFR